MDPIQNKAYTQINNEKLIIIIDLILTKISKLNSTDQLFIIIVFRDMICVTCFVYSEIWATHVTVKSCALMRHKLQVAQK